MNDRKFSIELVLEMNDYVDCRKIGTSICVAYVDTMVEMISLWQEQILLPCNLIDGMVHWFNGFN